MCDIMGHGFEWTNEKKGFVLCIKKYKVYTFVVYNITQNIQAGIFTKNKQSYKYFNLIPKKVTYLYENRYAYVCNV